MTTNGRTARRRGVAAACAAVCALLLAPASTSAAGTRSLSRCREHLVVSPAFATDGTAYCAAAFNREFVLYVTRDHAKTWTATRPAGAVIPLEGLAPSVSDFLISPDFATDRTLVVTLSGFVFYSTDAGATFVQAVGTGFDHLTMADALHGVSAEPSHGVLISAGRHNTSITARSAVLDPALPVQRPLVGTGSPDVAFLIPPSGSPDVAYAIGASGSTLATTQQSFYRCSAAYACPDKLGSLPTGHAFAQAWFAPDYPKSGVVFAATLDLQNRTHIYVSRDRARHFAPAPGLTAYLDQSHRAKLWPVLVLAPAKPGSRTIFARISGGGSSATVPTNRLFRSDDDGKTWRLVAWGRDPASGGPTGTMPYEYTPNGWDRIPQGLLAYTSDGRLLFAGDDRRGRVVWCSGDGGRTWRTACR